MPDNYEVRSSDLWEDDELRFKIDEEGNGLTMDGPMALFDTPSRPLTANDLGGKSRSVFERSGKRSFREIIRPGAFKKSLAENPDIVLHYQHDERTLPLGRTTAGTLRLTEEKRMVRSQADLPDNEWGRPVRDAVRRGDIGGLSFRMGQVREDWEFSGPEPIRYLGEIRLRREMSLVTFPGYDTPASIRALAEDGDVEPDALLEVFNTLKTPDARLTVEQRDLLMSAVNARVDEPYIDPKLVQMRERLIALAAG
jgi:HK97 family phage prohead protease